MKVNAENPPNFGAPPDFATVDEALRHIFKVVKAIYDELTEHRTKHPHTEFVFTVFGAHRKTYKPPFTTRQKENMRKNKIPEKVVQNFDTMANLEAALDAITYAIWTLKHDDMRVIGLPDVDA